MWVWKQSWMDAIPLCILRLNFRSNGHNRCHNPAPTSHLSIVQYVWTLTNVLSSASYLCQRGETADHTISFRFALMTDDSISLTRGMKSSKVGKGLKPAPHVLHGVAFTNVYILCGNVKRCSWLGFGLLPQMLHWILMNHQDFRLIKSPKKGPSSPCGCHRFEDTQSIWTHSPEGMRLPYQPLLHCWSSTIV